MFDACGGSQIASNDDFCGRSYNMGAPASAGFAPWAFNLVSQGCATGYYAFAHEFGHGFGLDHDRVNTNNAPSHPFAFGFWTPNTTYRYQVPLKHEGWKIEVREAENIRACLIVAPNLQPALPVASPYLMGRAPQCPPALLEQGFATSVPTHRNHRHSPRPFADLTE